MTQEALKLAREAFHQIFNTTPVYHNDGTCIINDKSIELSKKAIASLTQAIAELESQEPVAIVTGDAWETDIRFLPEGMALPPDTKLYTHPPQQRTEPVFCEYCGGNEENPPDWIVLDHSALYTWVGLTDEEIDSYFEDHGWSSSEYYYPVIKDIEAKLKELNT